MTKELPINQIIVGDSLEVMKGWPDGCVDLVLTSPPYGTLREYKGFRFNFEGIAGQLFRVIKPNGVLVWVVGDEVQDGSESCESFRHALLFRDIGFSLHDTMIYWKNVFAFPESTRYAQVFEYMFVLSKGSPATTNIIRVPTYARYRVVQKATSYRQKDGKTSKIQYSSGHDARNMENIWVYDAGFNKSTKDTCAYQHPAIFPDRLAEDHIVSWSQVREIVMDPMSGSGTTCIAAKKLGRRYVGIDISPEYCQIARSRLEAVDTGVPLKEAQKGQGALWP
jgi:site-specific DNA-methyltransferase (adenine-specific)